MDFYVPMTNSDVSLKLQPPRAMGKFSGPQGFKKKTVVFYHIGYN